MIVNHLSRARSARARGLLFAAGLAFVPASGTAQANPATSSAFYLSGSDVHGLSETGGARQHGSLWIHNGQVDPAAERLLRLIATVELDRLDADQYRPRALADAIDRAAGGSPKALARADKALTRALVTLARDMRRPRDVDVIYVDATLVPTVPTEAALLREASAQPSLADWIDHTGWMSPVYSRLRTAAVTHANRWGREANRPELAVIRANLDRARALPAATGRRFVLVDAAAQRLWMYEGDRIAGQMRVVVGKPSEPTPIMAALIRYASVNPYWNIPPDLVRLRVAPGAVEQGPGLIKAKRFQVLSGWEEDARVVDPASVDWQSVADGRTEARVRQLPGPGNAMGRIKFMFPNQRGVYLHDTPDKALLKEEDRMFSAGCVRLEDAPRLARWLFGRSILGRNTKADQRVNLPQPVPVYITYFTAAPEGEALLFRPDVYGLDGVVLAPAIGTLAAR